MFLQHTTGYQQGYRAADDITSSLTGPKPPILSHITAMARLTRIAAVLLLIACVFIATSDPSLASPSKEHLERFAQTARQLLQTADSTGNTAEIAAVASQQGLDLSTSVKAEDQIQTINENALKQQLVQQKFVRLSQQQEQQAMMEENMAILMRQRDTYESAMMEEARKKAAKEAAAAAEAEALANTTTATTR